MGFRLFGRSRNDDDEFACAQCGRTLLAGEWTQRLIDGGGDERYLCSLCARGESTAADDAPATESAPAGSGHVRSSRAESDAFWRAMKDKDAEIERLESRLARAEAEKQELTAELARLRGPDGASREVKLVPEWRSPPPEAPPEPEAAAPPAPPLIAPPAVAPAADTPLAVTAADEPVAPADGSVATDERESTDPRLDERMRTVREASEDTAPLAAPELEAPPRPVTAGPAEPATTQPGAPPDDESLTILQRGVDLLNVSAVPRRVVETNDSLGIPTVHVGSEGPGTLLVTFMWSLGWYQFRIELAGGGRVTLAERGYDQRTDLPPNATVRPDGTVQLAPNMARQPTPKEETPDAAPSVTSGVIISKSLMGQRTDDENVPPPWGGTTAPDFDWGR